MLHEYLVKEFTALLTIVTHLNRRGLFVALHVDNVALLVVFGLIGWSIADHHVPILVFGDDAFAVFVVQLQIGARDGWEIADPLLENLVFLDEFAGTLSLLLPL